MEPGVGGRAWWALRPGGLWLWLWLCPRVCACCAWWLLLLASCSREGEDAV